MTPHRNLAEARLEFHDPAGLLVGVAVRESLLPLRYVVYSETQAPIFALDAERERGLLFHFLVKDPDGATLATIDPESSFLSAKFRVLVDGTESMTLRVDASCVHYQLGRVADEAVLATGFRKWGLGQTPVEIHLSEPGLVDRRIALGAMILAWIRSSSRT